MWCDLYTLSFLIVVTSTGSYYAAFTQMIIIQTVIITIYSLVHTLSFLFHLCAVQVSPDGRALRMVGEGVLAGSCCSMIDILHNLVRTLDVPLGEAVAMLSENPARYIYI